MVRSRFTSLMLVSLLALIPFLSSQKVPVAQAAGETYQVDTTDDTGNGACTTAPNDCSLRSAMTLANLNPGSSIGFSIPASGPNYNAGRWTINLSANLPAISAAGTSINGPLSNGFIQIPGIIIKASTLNSAIGLRVQANAIQIIGLELQNFAGGGVQVQTSAGSTLKSLSVYNSGGFGIQVSAGATATTIGGTGVGEQVVIGGTTGTGDGLQLISSSEGTKLARSYIGFTLTPTGLIANNNKGNGIRIDGSSKNTIGGATGLPSPGNLIGNSDKNGVLITKASGLTTNDNTIAGNLIGLATDGTSAANMLSGVRIEQGASNNTIIGSIQNPSVIGFNGEGGVLIDGDATKNNRVLGSYIGVDGSGTAAAPNVRAGVLLTNNTAGNIIGDQGQGNIIAGNNGDGVYIGGFFGQSPTNTLSNTLKANLIGLDKSGTAALPNTAAGVFLADGSRQTVIGAAGAGNTIAGNGGAGVVITGTSTLSTTLVGNTIGLDRAKTNTLPNAGDGLLIGGGARGTVVGGPNAEAGNTIAGNAGNGVRITGTGTTSSTLRYLTAGTAAASTLLRDGLGNGANGVLVDAAASDVSIRNSTIFSNTLSGVKVQDTSRQVAIRDTRFSGNGVAQTGDNAKAIALVGTTIGAPGDVSKPNHDIDPPSSIRVNQAKQITGRVLTSGASGCVGCTIQFFSANPATSDGEGRDQLAVTNYQVAANGYFTATLPSLPRQLALTATDNQGNTSEFSTALLTTTVAISRVGTKPPSPGPSETVRYTFRVTNTGSVDLADLAVTTKSDKQWTATVQPTTLALQANPNGVGESKLVTVTLTLPVGTDPRVRVPTTDTTYVTVTSTLVPTATASASVTTTVTSKFVLKVDPPARSGEGVTTDPDNPVVIPYIHLFSNTGNLTGTVTLTATTDLFNPLVPTSWKTEIDRTTITLPPGGPPVAVTVRVTLPYGGANAGEVGKTTLKVTQTDPLPVQTSFYTDTTTITANKRATISPNRVGDGAATKVVSFEHTVTNFGNTPATFKLVGASSLGSVVSFRSTTAGITLGPDNTFTLGTSASNNVFTFLVDITVDQRALRGDTDLITITLENADGNTVGGVQDTINIVQGAVLPRAYLPLVARPR